MVGTHYILSFIYKVLLNREPDEVGKKSYIPLLREGKYQYVVENILKSGEFRKRFYQLNPLYVHGRPAKQIYLNNEPYTICGISPDDQYFKNLHDEYEWTFLKFIELFPSDWNAVDIGANIGIKALPLAKRLDQGIVIAIEASPQAFECLSINIKINKISNIRAKRYAVGTKEKVIHFIDNSAWGHIVEDADSRQAKVIQVTMKPLKKILQEEDIEKVDFIKIDIEGADIEIVKNIRKHYKRSLIMFEYNPFNIMLHLQKDPLGELSWVINNFKYIFFLKKFDHQDGKPFIEEMVGHKLEKMKRIISLNEREGGVSDIIVTNDKNKALLIRKFVT